MEVDGHHCYIITTISNEIFLSLSHFLLLSSFSSSSSSEKSNGPQLRKEKSVVEFISFSRILQEWNTKKLGELWKERSPYHFKFGIPPNKKKINSLKMWTLERLAPGTQSNSKTRKGKSPKRNSPRHRKARENGIWRYGERKETKRKKKHLKVNRMAREREIQNCGNKKARKKTREQSRAESRASTSYRRNGRSRYGGTRQRARTISIQNKINISIVMRHNRLQLFVYQSEL